MTRCARCGTRIEGEWAACPLCAAPTVPAAAPAAPGPHVPTPADPYPVVPLRYSHRRLLRALFLVSLGVILASFAAQPILGLALSEFGLVRSIWLGIATTWLVVLMAVRKRRNPAKSTLYLVVIVGLVCVYWDYLSGWHGWSLTYAVPIVCASAIIAVIILVRLMRIEPGDHVVYSGMTILLGIAPLAFVVFGQVSTVIPSLICGGLAVIALLALQIVRGHVLHDELGRRLHL